MTYRERRLRKAKRLREWAAKRDAKSAAAFQRTDELASRIPLGQPILVGHHSERHARRDAERIRQGMTAGIENQRKADEFESRADGIERAAEHAIYSDDPNAIEALTARIADLEQKREQIKTINKERRAAKLETYPAYVLANLSGNIARQRARLAELQRRATTEESR